MVLTYLRNNQKQPFTTEQPSSLSKIDTLRMLLDLAADIMNLTCREQIPCALFNRTLSLVKK